MRQKPRFAIPAALALGLALGFGLGFTACTAWNFPRPGFTTSGYEIVHEVWSDFQRISVVDTPDGFRQLIFDGRLDGSDAIQSEMNLADHYQLTRPYPRYLMTALPAAAKLERVLIVGLGGGSMQRYLRRLLPGLTIESVEIDPEVRRIAAEYFFFKEDEKQIVHLEDGAAFMARAGAEYDIIFLDAFGPASIPEPMRKREFLTAVKERLSEGGVVCSNLWYGAPEYFEVLEAYDAAFPERYMVKCGQGSANQIVLALPKKVGLGFRGWIMKAEEFERAHPTGLDLPSMLSRR